MSDHIWTPTSTLGDIADALRPMKDGGMTRDSMLFVIDKVWFEATQEEADGTAHDAAVAARALRDAVEWMDESTPDGVMVTRLQVFDFLNDYADRVEREGGAS